MAHLDERFSQIGLYIHIPFCRKKCAYCDFNSYAGLERLAPAYIHALSQEMRNWAALAERHELPSVAAQSGRLGVGTIYVGGGTPTVLDGDAIAGILSACRAAFALDPGAEVSVEANPGTVDARRLESLLAAGANRLSVGAQSFNPRLLRTLGRVHSDLEIALACSAARQAGFTNFSLDLIYGIPGQSFDEWREDLDRALALAPTHLSLYGLSVEEGTPLADRIARDLLAAPDPDLAADMYLWAQEALGNCGYQHYEISNWAMPGAACRHNLGYWLNLPYLGLGAGAHSSFCSARLANSGDPFRYISKLESACRDGTVGHRKHEGFHNGFIAEALARCAVEEVTELDIETQKAETAILGLRLIEGIDGNRFRARFGVDFLAAFGQEIEELSSVGLIEKKGNNVALTDRGRLLGNEVFVRFLPK